MLNMVYKKHNAPNITKKFMGFTLIELVLVIVILSILAAVSLPKFINLSTKAKDNNDSYVLSALNSAIKIKQVQNIASGISPGSSWPGNEDLFLLMDNPPAYRCYDAMSFPAEITMPSSTWWKEGTYATPNGYVHIWCPHVKFSAGQYIYCRRYAFDTSNGSLILEFDNGH